MNEPWYRISNIKCNPGKSVSANAIAAKDSPWFSGHFPGEPILPGIAQLSMVFDVIKECFNLNNENLSVTALKKVKFKSIIKPEELLDILVTLSERSENTFLFEITSNGNTACSGIITV